MGTLRALADTSLFIGLEQNRADSIQRPLAVSMITIGELRLGVLNAADQAARAARLRTFQQAFALDPIPVDDLVADAWAVLRSALSGRRMGVNNSWIAATAIAHGLPLVTQDRDFDDVPGLDVVTL
jgi:predicted nucleic acid-binding protein